MIAANKIHDFQETRKEQQLFAFFDETDWCDILKELQEAKSGQKSNGIRRRKLKREEYRTYVRRVHIFLLEKLQQSGQQKKKTPSKDFPPETDEVVQTTAEDIYLDKQITLKKPIKTKGGNRLYVIKIKDTDHTAFKISPQTAYIVQYLYDLRDKRVEKRSISYKKLQEKHGGGIVNAKSELYAITKYCDAEEIISSNSSAKWELNRALDCCRSHS